MIVSYGNLTLADGSTAVRITYEPVRSEGDQYYAYKAHWALTGTLEAADQATLLTEIAALEGAFGQDNLDLVLTTFGGVTAASLSAAHCIGGTRILSGPNYPEDGQRDAEFSTFRRFQVEIEGLVPTGNCELLAWAESLSFRGTGGPRFGFAQPLVGPPQKQLLVRFTPVRVVQQGRAIGFTDYPDPPPPQWPDDVKEDEIEIKKSPPKRYGPPGQAAYREFEIEWTYPHEGLGPFNGAPTQWPT